MAISKDELMAKTGLECRAFKSTLRCCGLDPARTEFSDEDVARVAKARRLKEELRTYARVAAHFGVEWKDASGSGEGNGAALAAGEEAPKALVAAEGSNGAVDHYKFWINQRAATAEVDPRYLSFAVDTAQLVGGVFWNPDGEGTAPVPPYDFDNAKLRRMAQELAPAYLRLGGTDADLTYYDLSDSPVTEAPPGFSWVLDRQQWDSANAFAADLGLDVLFTLNAGPGPRDAEQNWLDVNARDLVQYTVDQGYPVPVWELGNEVNLYIYNFGFRRLGAEFAQDTAVARAMLDELAPGTALAAPASAFWPVIGEIPAIEFGGTPFSERTYAAFLQAGGGDNVDVLTWHFYPTQSFRCPFATRAAQPGVFLNKLTLNAVSLWSFIASLDRDNYAPGLPLWLGETGSAQCGGEPGVSDTFESGFFWLDQLGRVARTGQPVVVRQSLSGASYGFIDDTDLSPNPDYFLSVLWKRLMGSKVLGGLVTGGDSLRAYAHCTAETAPNYVPGAVTVAALNLATDAAAKVRLPFFPSGSVDLYALSAPALDSKTVNLNGVPLAVAADGSPPALLPLQLPASSGAPCFTIPPASYAFAVLPHANAAACM